MTEIVRATKAEHFAHFQELVDELMAWDSSMTAQIGLDVDVMLDLLYNQPTHIGHEEAHVDVFLATDDGSLAGCGALKHLSNEVAELSRLYVRPTHRGTGRARRFLKRFSPGRALGVTKKCVWKPPPS